MKIQLFFYAVLLLSISASASAVQQDKIVTCNGCSVASHQTLARQAAPRNQDSTRVHIFDQVRKSLHSYEVIRERDVGPFPIYFVVPTGTPHHIHNQYVEYVNALNEFEMLKNMIDTVPSDVASSAWDMVYDPAARQRVGDWFQSNQPVYTSFSSVVNLATGFIGLPALSLRFEFADGSYAVFKYVGLDSSGSIYYKLVPEQSRDADGNNLNLSESNNFSDRAVSFMSLNDFLAAAARAGIPIVINGGPMGGVPVRCVKTGDKIVCTPINDPR